MPALSQEHGVRTAFDDGPVLEHQNRDPHRGWYAGGAQSRCACSAARCRCTCASVMASRALMASSRSMIAGRCTSARASATRCRCPPDREPPPSRSRVSYPIGMARMSSWMPASRAASTTCGSGIVAVRDDANPWFHGATTLLWKQSPASAPVHKPGCGTTDEGRQAAQSLGNATSAHPYEPE